jgi:hypothetical protein
MFASPSNGAPDLTLTVPNMRLSDSRNTGDPYERYAGRRSRLVVDESLAWLDPPSSLRWLVAGCGAGAPTAAIAEQCRPARVTAVDRAFWPSRTRVLVKRLPFALQMRWRFRYRRRLPTSSFRAWCSPFIPDTGLGLAEMRRACAPGGTVAGYVWDYSGRWSSCAISGTLPSTWTPTCASSMKAFHFGCADRMPWRARFEVPTSPRPKWPRSMLPRDFATSTTTGRRSRRTTACAVVCRVHGRVVAQSFRGIESASDRPVAPMDRSRWLPAPGRSRTESPNDAGFEFAVDGAGSAQLPVDARRGARPKGFLLETP